MKKIGIVYSFNTTHTSKVAKKIKDALKDAEVEDVNVEDIDAETFTAYDNLIIGASTWFDGELPNYWDEFVPEIEEMDLSGKKIAIFGLGDQKNYPQNFADALGIMADLLESCGADVVGYTSADGYSFESSKAYEEGQFKGLAIDNSNQGALTNERVVKWVEQLKKEFH